MITIHLAKKAGICPQMTKVTGGEPILGYWVKRGGVGQSSGNMNARWRRLHRRKSAWFVGGRKG